MAEAEPGTGPRLARVEAIHVRVPFRRPLLDASGEFTHRRSWLLRMVGEDGAEGLGEAALNPFAEEVTTASLATLIRAIVPAMAAGQMPVWSELAAEGEPGRAAMACVDGAMAALLADRADRAARAERGVDRSGSAGRPAGTAAKVPVVAIIGFGGPGAGADAAAQAVELGFGTLKLRAGFERTTDQLVDRIRAIRGVRPEGRLVRSPVKSVRADPPARIETGPGSAEVALRSGRSWVWAPRKTAADRAGAAEAFERAVAPHYAPLVRRLAVVLGDQAEAQDVAQEAYLQAFRSWTRFGGGDVRAWLYTIGLRLAFNELRRRRRQLAAIGRLKPRPWHDSVDPDLAAAIGSLESRARAAFLLNVVDGYTQPEIAAILSVPVGTVASWISRARSRLRAVVDPDQDVPWV